MAEKTIKTGKTAKTGIIIKIRKNGKMDPSRIAILLAVVLALGCSACGTSGSGSQSENAGTDKAKTESAAGASGETDADTSESGSASAAPTESGTSAGSRESGTASTAARAGSSASAESTGAQAGSSAYAASTGAQAGASGAEDGTTAGAGAFAATGSTAEEASSSGGTGAEGQQTAAEYRGLVVIDPGHQRYENAEQEPVGPGASETKIKVSGGTSGTASGVPEYQLTLDIGLQLRDELEKRGYQVIMIRENNDVDISNSERAAIANDADADVFIRIHANGVGDSGHTGAMTICQTPDNPYNGDLYKQSRELSDAILNAYTARTGIDYEYVWETDTMSGINWSRVPVTILEMGYMSNAEEDLKMQDPDMQVLMTEGIADGIDAYMREHLPKEREDSTAGSSTVSESSKSSKSENTTDMKDLEKLLRKELKEKDGEWSLYIYRLDTKETIRIHADRPMISASLIKLYIAGCYLEAVETGEIEDEYENQLFVMISESDNGAANTLIDVLGRDRINTYIEENRYRSSELNRKMLENNGTENYTSAADCGRVLRKIQQKTFVSKKASRKLRRALKAQIGRNRSKIPAGVPEDVVTANKTGELFTKNAEGVSVDVQNDAAIIYGPDNTTYIMVVMSSVPGAGEDQLHREIADLSAMVYEAICGTE